MEQDIGKKVQTQNFYQVLMRRKISLIQGKGKDIEMMGIPNFTSKDLGLGLGTRLRLNRHQHTDLALHDCSLPQLLSTAENNLSYREINGSIIFPAENVSVASTFLLFA
ncbi:hypothetical protein XELAEV_18037201mg [Xenopus laevis]|uniref:Uncharacterized protein n=1 Tax=Xenopus laevis TaxID=8355 RepID=A0A974H9Y4_XENLA|nr:hypothetical protein XELAEV_18037201mg [Xenopus laevis]